jgi:glutathione S-transferase
MTVEEWLEDWVDTNINGPRRCENKSEMRDDAEACRAAAKKAGIAAQQLLKAANGDLEAFLCGRQNGAADAIVWKTTGRD